jgi:hypothetical protein
MVRDVMGPAKAGNYALSGEEDSLKEVSVVAFDVVMKGKVVIDAADGRFFLMTVASGG